MFEYRLRAMPQNAYNHNAFVVLSDCLRAMPQNLYIYNVFNDFFENHAATP